MPTYTRRISILFFTFLMILFLTACGQTKPSPEIQLVQNSKAAYGTVYNALGDLGQNSIIQRMPTFKGATDKLFSDSVWSSGKDSNGQTLVQLDGVVKIEGVQTPIIIQWRIEGDLSTNTAYPVLHGFAMFNTSQPKAMFNLFTLQMLQALNILSEEDAAILATYMAIDYLFSN